MVIDGGSGRRSLRSLLPPPPNPRDDPFRRPRENSQAMHRKQRLILLCLTVGLASISVACSDSDQPRPYTPTVSSAGGGSSNIGGSGGGTTTNNGGAAGSGGDPTRFEPLVESLQNELDDLGVPGVAVAVIEGGKVTFSQGFGSKHPDTVDPVQPTTLFRIGSVNKMLTSVGLLQLVEQGQVTLDAPITDYLTEFSFSQDPNWAPSIKVQHLLAQTSAIFDYLEIDVAVGYKADNALANYLNGVFETFAYLMAPAGRMYNYSNPNFMLAGLLTETVSGQYYREYLDQHVFTPLGMDRTFFLPANVLADGDYAYGDTVHWETGDPLVAAPDSYDNAWARPAGYAFSSVLDLAKLVLFLRNGNTQVLADAQWQAMQQPQFDTEELLDLKHYGYGLFIDNGFFINGTDSDYYNMKMISHGGDISGFAADVYYVPDLDFGFVTLANGDGGHFRQSLAVAIETLCALPAPAQSPDLTIDPDTFDLFTGEYYDEHSVGTIEVTRQANVLYVSIPALDAGSVPYQANLLPYRPNNFVLYIQNFPLVVTFIMNEQGTAAEYFRTRAFVATRVSTPSGAPGAQGITPRCNPELMLRQLPRITRHRPRRP